MYECWTNRCKIWYATVSTNTQVSTNAHALIEAGNEVDAGILILNNRYMEAEMPN